MLCAIGHADSVRLVAVAEVMCIALRCFCVRRFSSFALLRTGGRSYLKGCRAEQYLVAHAPCHGHATRWGTFFNAIGLVPLTE